MQLASGKLAWWPARWECEHGFGLRCVVQATEALAQLKADGNNNFAKREYDTALRLYDEALKLVPADAADAALLHSNKAACHMMHKRCVRCAAAWGAAAAGRVVRRGPGSGGSTWCGGGMRRWW